MTFVSKTFFAATACAAVVFASAALADRVNTNSDNIAIEGYDPVAYFTKDAAVPGVPDFQTEWQDATWQFSSADHKALFEANPVKYAPRYGGFCSAGVSLGHRSEIDPNEWMIVDGKLFLSGSKGATKHMNSDLEENIAKADKNWESLGATN